MSQEVREEESRQQFDEVVIRLLREELGDPDISKKDNFLDVGGHSLVAAKVNQSLSEHFGKKVPLRALFEETLGDACRLAEPA